MNDASEKTPQIVVVGKGPPARPAVEIVAHPSAMPKWTPIKVKVDKQVPHR